MALIRFSSPPRAKRPPPGGFFIFGRYLVAVAQGEPATRPYDGAMARIPSALKFLVTRRSYLAGERAKADRAFAERLSELDKGIADTSALLRKLKSERRQTERVAQATRSAREKDIRSVDHVIGLHPLEIDPSKIDPVQGHTSASILPRSLMTRAIYEYLGMANGKQRGVTEIAVFVVTKHCLRLNEAEFLDFRHRVRHRLKSMAHEGRLRRFRSPVVNAETWYALLPPDLCQRETAPGDLGEKATRDLGAPPASIRATKSSDLNLVRTRAAS